MNPPLVLIFQQRLFRKESDVIEQDNELLAVNNYEELSLEEVRLLAEEGEVTIRPAREFKDHNEKVEIYIMLHRERMNLETAALRHDNCSLRDCSVIRTIASMALAKMTRQFEASPCPKVRAEIDRVREIFKLGTPSATK